MGNSFPLSNVIPISVVTSPQAAPGLSFNQGLIVGSSAVIPTVGTNQPRLRLYTSVTAMVADGFTTTDPEYLAATLYFGQAPAPTYLWIGRQNLTAIDTVTVGSSGGAGYVVGDILTVVQSGASGGLLNVSTVGTSVAATTTGTTPTATTTATASLGATVLVVASATGVVVGQTVSGTGIALNTLVTNVSGTNITISLATTGALSAGSVTFTSYFAMTVASATGIAIGQQVAGTGVVAGTLVTNIVSTLVTLSIPTTATLSSTAVTFTSLGVVTGLTLIQGSQGNNYSTASNLSTTGGTGSGATVTITGIGETPLQAVVACRLAQPAWYSCMFVGTAADADYEAIAGFIEAASPASTFFLTSGEAAVLNNTANNLFATLQAESYRRTFMMYSTTQGGAFPNNIYASAAVMGKAMGLNSGAPGSYFAIMFKSIAGVGYEPLTQTQMNTICGTNTRSQVGLNGNVYANYQNNSYEWVQFGTMAGGSFFDQTLFLDMLVADMQTSGVNLFIDVPALPITNQGVTQMKNVFSGACSRSQAIGFIAPSGTWNGVTVGPISAGDPLPAGFFVYAPPVSTLSAGQRAARQLPAMTVLLIESESGMSVAVSIEVQQ